MRQGGEKKAYVPSLCMQIYIYIDTYIYTEYDRNIHVYKKIERGRERARARIMREENKREVCAFPIYVYLYKHIDTYIYIEYYRCMYIFKKKK
jgi:hypothetical protein